MRAAGDRLAGILAEDQDNYIFLHNTKTIETANRIMNDGFNFESQLTYSTDRVNAKDPVEISYFLVERKDYGNLTVIIEINRTVFLRYLRLAEASNLHFEELFTITTPRLSDNDEYIYTLSPRYIKGIFNIRTGEIIPNPKFDPLYESPLYVENYERLKEAE